MHVSRGLCHAGGRGFESRRSRPCHPARARGVLLAGPRSLGTLLLAYSVQYSAEELVREMTERPDEFAERDAVLNALRDLARAGLVHRHGPFAFATRAAVRYHELEI
jgi:Fe2+ or Zn2+ uptake regulation protein